MVSDPWTPDSEGAIKLPHLSLAGRSCISQPQTRPSLLIFGKCFLMPKQALDGGKDLETGTDKNVSPGVITIYIWSTLLLLYIVSLI